MEDIAAESKNTKPVLAGLRRRTVVSVLRAWRDVKGTARSVIAPNEVRPSVPREDVDVLKKQMEECLHSRGGEVTARAHTAELGRTYLGLNDVGKARFLKLLATAYDIDRVHVETAIDAYKNAKNDAERLACEAKMRQALTSPRMTILRQFTALPDGFKFLVDLRADLSAIAGKDVALKGLEADVKTVLSSWFDIGLLDLVEMSWQSPAALLEKLIEYEAVHQIRSWDDLKNRLDSDRRIYAFFHNKMPLEPLIFVQVAFVKGMADNVQALLDLDSPALDIHEADTAIFYSISNAQRGLAGISFGNFLIKRVVAELEREFPNIKTFATLSPVPGFRGWLDPILECQDESILLPAEVKALRALSGKNNAAEGLLSLLNSDWHKNARVADGMKDICMRLCSHYLLEEKRNGKPLDPVSNFHLANGARLERVNWLGDTSPKGLKQAAGIMVNYHYKLSDIDDNHEEFVAQGKIVASRQVRGYLK